MGDTANREAIDSRIKEWERELEEIRIALAAAPEALHAEHEDSFVRLYRAKEVLKSRWEAIRGIYRPDAAAVERYEQALKIMDSTWAETAPVLKAAIATVR